MIHARGKKYNKRDNIDKSNNDNNKKKYMIPSLK